MADSCLYVDSLTYLLAARYLLLINLAVASHREMA